MQKKVAKKDEKKSRRNRKRKDLPRERRHDALRGGPGPVAERAGGAGGGRGGGEGSVRAGAAAG